MGITSEQIMAAADELQRSGTTPTLVAVREILGAKGSFSTIAPVMAKWRARNAQTDAVKVGMPAAFAARIKQQAEHAWADALSVAEETVASERDALRAARKELEAERVEMASLLDQAGIRLEEAETHQVGLESRIEALINQAAAAKAELSAAGARLDERERALNAERAERQSAQDSLTQSRERLAQLEEAIRACKDRSRLSDGPPDALA